MLSEQEKKEMLEDAVSKKRQKAFEEADKRVEVFMRRHLTSITADKAIKFLMDTQEAIGPFPVSKEITTNSSNFRL